MRRERCIWNGRIRQYATDYDTLTGSTVDEANRLLNELKHDLYEVEVSVTVESSVDIGFCCFGFDLSLTGKAMNGMLKVNLFFDRITAEAFVNDGAESMVQTFMPVEGARPLEFHAEDEAEVVSVKICLLRSI